MPRLFTKWLVVLTMFFEIVNSTSASAAEKVRVYVGTYTDETTRGIYLSEFDSATGQLLPAQLAAEVKNPSFVALHPNGKYLYSVSEIADFQGQPVGGVTAFKIQPATGLLTLLNQQSSAGAGPCHLVVDAAGKNVLVANYGGGSVSVLPIAPNGQLSPASSSIQHHGSSVNKQRQEAPHAHSINLDPANKFAFAADLGLDKVLIYQFNRDKGLIIVNDPPAGIVSPGSGPRHFALHSSGKFAFVNNELTSSVTSFAYDATRGGLTEIQTLSTLPEPTPGNSTAETVVHPTGKFVYVSNRGHNSLAIFECDATTGKLTAMGHQSTEGKTPRNFNIDPSGRYILAANQDSNTVVVLKIDSSTGQLTSTGNSINVGRPVCIRFAPIP